VPSKEWMIDKYPKRELWLKKMGTFGHKKTKQKGKLETINLLPHEASER